MAATATAQRLTEAHRLAQARLAAQTASLTLATWPLLDIHNLDATTARWLRATVPVVRAQHAASARLAANYVDLLKKLELGAGAQAPRILAALNVEALTTSLIVTGPVSVKAGAARGASGLALARHAEVSATKVAGAAMRHTLAGGRDTTLGSVRADGQALGYARSTSGKPCAFCAMLASRGPVYKDDSFDRSDPRFTGFGDAKVHDNCWCSLEPVYRRDADWPGAGRRYEQMWKEAKRMDGEPAVNFRRLIEGRVPA